MRAVAAGNKPTTTAPCDEGTSRMAIAVRRGNPTTTPTTVRPKRSHNARRGTGTRYQRSSKMAQAAATGARPKPTTRPSIVATAILVAGSVIEKAVTPRKPQSNAETDVRCLIGSSRPVLITSSFVFIKKRRKSRIHSLSAIIPAARRLRGSPRCVSYRRFTMSAR